MKLPKRLPGAALKWVQRRYPKPDDLKIQKQKRWDRERGRNLLKMD